MRTLLPFLLAPAAALAQERPLVQPSRDVTATYRLAGAAAGVIPGGTGGSLRLRWDAAGQRLRVEADGRPQALVVDLPARSALLLDRGARTAVSLPVRERDLQPLSLEGARLTRRGTEQVAGLPCTDWAVQSPRGAGTVCLTADGVPLRAEGTVDGKRGSFTATEVQYGPVPPDLFAPPPGYFSLNFSALGRRP